MSTTYVLTWEEFMDPYWDTLPKPSVTSLVACVLIAFALGVFGAMLTYAVDAGDKLMASTFLWMSLLLFLAAFWDFKFRTAKRRAWVLRELRSVYERYKSTEETFDFDDDKWVLHSKTATQEVPWKSLLRAVDLPSVVSLASQNAAVVVPQRAMQKQRLAALLQIAFDSVQQRWEFQLSLWDYVLTEVASLWRNHPFLMTEAHAAGVCFFAMIAYGMYDKAGPGVLWGWVLAWVFLFLTATTQFWYFSLKYLTAHKDLQAKWEAEFNSRGVRLKMPRSETFLAWAALRKFRESKRAFLLYINPNLYYIVPKRGFSTEQQRTMRELLQAKLVTV